MMNIQPNNTSMVFETKLHRFECESPITSEEVVRDQMQLARVYFQVLLEIEQERKAALRKASRKFAELSDKEANSLLLSYEIQDLQMTLNNPNNTSSHESTLARIAYLRTELKTSKLQLKALREEVRADQELMATAAQIDQIAREKVKFARKNSGVYWGTYLMVEASISKKEAVASTYPPPMPSSSIPHYGTVINFNRRKDSEGRVGIRLQQAVSVKEIYKCLDSRFRLEQAPTCVHAWIRVGSNPGNIREPVWAIFPVRGLQLRKDALITAVNVTNVVRGNREKWFLDVWTLEGQPKIEQMQVPAELLPPTSSTPTRRRSSFPPAVDVLLGKFQQPVIATAQRLARRLLPQWVQGAVRSNEPQQHV